MDTTWVWLAATVPLVFGLAAAIPFWRKRVHDEIGSIVGTFVILVFAVTFMTREFGEVEKFIRRCVELNIGCQFHPAPFLRYSIFPIIGMVQAFVVLWIGLVVEEWLRRKHE